MATKVQDSLNDKRQSQVNEKIDKQVLALDDLDNVWSTLKGRLDPVCREPTPEVDSEKKAQEDLVPLAAALRNSNGRVSRVARQVEDVLNRLEL